MATNITDVDEFTDPVTAPADGDAANAATFLAGLQKLSNRTRFLLNKVWVATPATVVRWVGTGYQSSSDSAANEVGWMHLHADPGIAVSAAPASRAKRLLSFDHVLPNGCTITQVRVRVDPSTAQASAGNRMSAQVFVNGSAGTVTSSTKTTDDGTDAAQWITISGLAIVVDKTQRSYAVAVESSANFVLDQCFGAEVTFTTSKLSFD